MRSPIKLIVSGVRTFSASIVAAWWPQLTYSILKLILQVTMMVCAVLMQYRFVTSSVSQEGWGMYLKRISKRNELV